MFFFRVFLCFLLLWIVFSLLLSIFHDFSLPQQRVRLFHVNHRRGRVVLSRFWHSLTWNKSTIWAPKQLPFFPDLGLLHFLEMLLTSDSGGCPLLTPKVIQMSNFKYINNSTGKRISSSPNSGLSHWTPRPHRWLTWNRRIHCPNRREHSYCIATLGSWIGFGFTVIYYLLRTAFPAVRFWLFPCVVPTLELVNME